jgi:hypothetical protein
MFAPEEIEKLPTDTLEAEIASLYSKISAETCRWLLLVAELDRREAYLKWECHSCAHWLSWHCGVALRAAQDQVRVARRLGDLPRITQAFSRGHLSYSKVRALTRVADEQSEGRLLELALDSTAAQLERIVSAYRRATTAPDPSGLAERRFATFSWDDDGCLELHARLTPDEGAIVMKALAQARDELHREVTDQGVANERPDGRPIREARTTNADALIRLAESGVAARGSRATGGDSTQVVIHVDADALRDGEAGDDASPGRCELEGGPGIHTHTARRLACDAGVVTMLERDGEPLSVGRKTRTIPPAVRRALRARDGGCRFPGCTADRFIDAHHIKHWADGGATELGNLIHLCRRHHRLLHEGAVRLESGPDGDFVFRKQRGQVLESAPWLPGAEPTHRSVDEALAATPTPAHRLSRPLGACAPRHGRQPLDLELTVWCALQDHKDKPREIARAGPAP